MTFGSVDALLADARSRLNRVDAAAAARKAGLPTVPGGTTPDTHSPAG